MATRWSLKAGHLVAAFVCAVAALLITQGAAFADEGDYSATQSAALTAQGQQVTRVSMLRVYNPNSGEHFYTADVKERDHLTSLGWQYEGVGWVAPSKSNTPVYRMYNPVAGDHHYTMSASERDWLVSQTWKYEGIGWYSADHGACAGMYREYNPNAYTGAHNYTLSASEHLFLYDVGWNVEGVAWYALIDENQPKNGWLWVDGVWKYYVNNTQHRGWMVTGTPPAFAVVGSGLQRYWLDVNGNLAINRDIGTAEAGYDAFATPGGFIATNCWIQRNGTWYWANNDGAWEYDAVVNRLILSAQGYSSPSQYLIMVDIDDPRVVVLEGWQGNWNVKFVWDCCTGMPGQDTIEGVFSLGIKGYSFGESHGYSCYYYSQIWGDYLFHTTLYYANTHITMDGRMGERVTNGCVRLHDDDAYWIYSSVPSGTTVVTMY